MGTHLTGYDQGYSITLLVKRLEENMERILTIFTTIDLSNNKFKGAVPDSIGLLLSLRYLKLSHNSLTGRIPALLRNLTVLESLDFSSNKLVGEIPHQLTALTFLAVLNLSHNQLSGRIPQGQQFSTFQNDSYQGNLELCGSPLTKKCKGDEASPAPTSPAQQEDDDASFFDGFTWESDLMGYGVRTSLGLSIGTLVLILNHSS